MFEGSQELQKLKKVQFFLIHYLSALTLKY